MPKDKRKARLNKATDDFIGFSAFAQPSSSASTATPTNAATLSPIYLGSNSEISTLFQRIGQKRDSTTKSKALQELKSYFQDTEQPKKSQVEAMSHFLHLYLTKTHYDNSPNVRYEALSCVLAAFTRLPKAFNSLVLQQQQPNQEVVGMIYCSQLDPSADVRAVSQELWKSIESNLLEKRSTDHHRGIWSYVERIATYGKPKVMHDALFAKKSEKALSELQVEELEERFERIVGTALDGFRSWVHHQQQQKTTTERQEGDTSFIYKSMTSFKPSIRRRGYGILATMYQNPQNTLDHDKTDKLLLQSLSSEKEATSVPGLLEALLSYLSFLDKDVRKDTVHRYSKALNKLLKRACYGASTSQWAPMLLPIVASSDDVHVQASFLSSAWEGSKDALSTNDRFEICFALVETASFLLKREHDDAAQPDVEHAKGIAQIILDCLAYAAVAYALSVHSTGSTKLWHKKILTSLATTLDQFRGNLSTASPFFITKDWFWNEGFAGAIHDEAAIQDSAMSILLRKIDKDAKNEALQDALTRTLHNVLHGKLKQFTHSVPSHDVYELILSIVQYCDLSKIFGDGPADDNGDSAASLQKFVMNDLLRWMIVHSSSISNSKSEAETRITFSIFGVCFAKGGDSISWNSVLRELITAQCDVKLLDEGMRQIMKSLDGIEPLMCPELDLYCTSLARTTGTSNNATHDMKEFLATVAGLRDGNIPLISSDTIDSWLASCPIDGSPPWPRSNDAILDTLIQLTTTRTVSSDHYDRIFVQAWRQGGSGWSETSKLLLSDSFSESRKTVTQKIIHEIKAFWNNPSAESMHDEDGDVDGDAVEMWCDQVMRFNEFQMQAVAASYYSESESILEFSGLSNADSWSCKLRSQEHVDFALKCFARIVARIKSADQRWEIFGEGDKSQQLLHDILCAASHGDTMYSTALSSRRSKDRFGEILKLFCVDGGSTTFPHSQGKAIIDLCLKSLAESGIASLDDDQVSKEITVAGQMAALLYPRIEFTTNPSTAKAVSQSDFKAGEPVWYVTSSNDSTACEQVEIVKVHQDQALELYYTIRTFRDGGSQERQTVPERLRRNKSSLENSGVDENDSVGNEKNRVHIKTANIDEELLLITGVIMKKILQPNVGTLKPYQMELLSIMTMFCGYEGRRGIGSLHHDAIRLLSAIQEDTVNMLTGSNTKQEDIDTAALEACMWKLSLALGFGLNCPPAKECMMIIGFDPSSSVRMIAECYEGNRSTFNSISPTAILAWLCVAFTKLESDELQCKTLDMLYTVASDVFKQRHEHDTCTRDHFIALRALQMVVETSSSLPDNKFANNPTVAIAQDNAVLAMIQVFSQSWTSRGDAHGHEDEGFNGYVWGSPLRTIIKTLIAQKSSSLMTACKSCANDLVRGLFVAEKQSLCLRLLHYQAGMMAPICDIESVEFSEATIEKMQVWGDGLGEDEIEDMKEDVAVAVQWLPSEMMKTIEAWSDEDRAETDDFTNCSNLLLWLSLLEDVEAAASHDSVNRQAITSYISKTEAVGKVLDWGTQYAAIILQKTGKIENAVFDLAALMQHPETSTLSELAELVIFRTIEVFPALSKVWWEMDCPKAYVARIKEFVIAHVSPEILRRELRRIQRTVAFGEMAVIGSLATREVVASYAQDDFKLSVAIRLPLAFPFVSAEVDCSKTYGISESRWKRCSLMIKMMLNSQGGTLQDALAFWKENVDKEFEGVEPCPVCYSVLHVKTHKLPNLQCNTCQHRFHVDCLSQWFRSSGKNACVLCQQPW
eukprot:CAMPEP_0119572450 /NCGR_PEP_ID=MMETSP1352-20130426/44628_1 /TAXON_ID=265584 /ORGANISM="Stauroneis constricta, Strain CCMP1120" /LENGTH=1761 /DNA_ID=CAMNT_0007622135 /DNA_START=8 /DNA_END=5289 /DNA_ORIENTATION=-